MRGGHDQTRQDETDSARARYKGRNWRSGLDQKDGRYVRAEKENRRVRRYDLEDSSTTRLILREGSCNLQYVTLTDRAFLLSFHRRDTLLGRRGQEGQKEGKTREGGREG